MTDAPPEQERTSPGSTLVRDPETGFITGATLTPERAREIGSLGGKSMTKEQRKNSDELGEALASMVTDDMPNADGARLILRRLGTQAARDNMNTTKALELAMKVLGMRVAPDKQWDGTGPCPTCKRPAGDRVLASPEIAKALDQVVAMALSATPGIP